jgi:hypothetical protein
MVPSFKVIGNFETSLLSWTWCNNIKAIPVHKFEFIKISNTVHQMQIFWGMYLMQGLQMMYKDLQVTKEDY